MASGLQIDLWGDVVDPLLTAAAGGLRSRSESLDILANNLSNANTSGFKGDLERFAPYISADAQADPAFSMNSPNLIPDMDKNWIDFTQGIVERTDRNLDLAITGKGFFSVQGPQGKLYTRNGNFQLSREGTLTSAQGYTLLQTDGTPLKIDPALSVEITSNGEVIQQGQPVGTIPLFEPSDPESVSKFGLNYFKWSGPTTAVNEIAVRQGFLEGANVSPAQSAVRLVNIMRQFESLQKAISLSSEMNRHAVEEVAKVTG